MSLILIMTIVQAVASTVAWLGSGARHAHQRRRGRYGLPDRARPGLRHAARVPSSLLCTDRPAAQNLATAAARRVLRSIGNVTG